MNVRSYVFLKMLLFLKMLSLVLNLLTQNTIIYISTLDHGSLADEGGTPLHRLNSLPQNLPMTGLEMRFL